MASDIVITPSRGSTSVNAKIDFTGASTASSQIRLEVLPDNSLSFVGTTGSLFSIADSVTGSLMSVNDASGLPILEVFDTDKVVMGQYNQNTLVVNGTQVGIGTGSPTNKLTIAGVNNNGITLTGTNATIASTGATPNLILSAGTNIYLRPTSGYNVVVDSGDGINITSGSIKAPAFYYNSDTSSRWVNGYQLFLRGSQPTIYFRDTDHNSAMIHVNSNIFYVLRGATDSEGWSQVNGRWPMEIDLTNNNMAIGGNLNVAAGTGTVTAATFTGNAGTATTLQTARTIAGVSFNGSANISITGQNITNSSGTASNDIEVAKYLRWKNYGNNHILIDASAGTNPGGGAIDKYTPANTINSTGAGGSTWGEAISLMGWNGSATYGVRVDRARSIDNQANSATTTAASTNTANQIVLRDGSGNFSAGAITASTFTGSGTSTLSRLNVAGYSMRSTATIDMSNTGTYATTNYYPVTIPLMVHMPTRMRIVNALNSNVPSWSTHASGFTCHVEWTSNGSGWGTIPVIRSIDRYTEAFTNSTICGGITQMTHSSTEVIWLRGGGQYYFEADADVTPTARSSTYTVNGQSVSPTSTAQNNVWDAATNSIATSRIYSTADIRSPIFYDYNDTAYFIDPDATEGGKIKNNFTVNGSGSAAGRGLALYPEYTSNIPQYGITFAQTANLGTHGNVSGDWATYFTMNSSANRGWIFRDLNTPTNVASISNAGRMRIASLGVNTDASATNGEIRATDNITAYYSDERLKTKLGAIQNPIEKVKALSGFYFEANETAVALGYQKKREVGVSAQEVQAILPEIIAPAPIDEQYMTVRYEKLIPLLIEAIKEQQKQIEELKSLLNK